MSGQQPSKNGPSPGEEGPCSGKMGPSPAAKGPSPGEEGLSPADKGPSWAGKGPRPGKEGPRLVKKGLSPANEGPSPADEGPNPSKKEPSPADEGPSRADKGSSPGKKGPSCADKGSNPADKRPRSSKEGPSLAKDQAEAPVHRWSCDSTKMGSLQPPKVNSDVQNTAQAKAVTKPAKRTKSRFDSSLFVATRKLMNVLRNDPEGVLHLKSIPPILGITKRRLYDVTSVLYGIHVVEKVSKNKIRWIGPALSNFEPLQQQKEKLQEEVNKLSAKERALDELIKDCADQLFQLTDDKENERLAYVTCQDVRSIQVFREQMVLALKAPAESMVTIPPPREDSITLHVQSTKGPIEFYLFDLKQDCSSDKVSEAMKASSSKTKDPDKKENPPDPTEELIDVCN